MPRRPSTRACCPPRPCPSPARVSADQAPAAEAALVPVVAAPACMSLSEDPAEAVQEKVELPHFREFAAATGYRAGARGAAEHGS
ncbi:hypothetical protein EVJ58_g10591 [Rhodofomes roseus]|uniref:Uncharacterized protein n=1 Tax=Rhodofomes roseus TaxID=34475 RepID=A0A4Y9XS92_9APHY|nr:hypothetical protein EVJ58_g10591 [Rhodofomes roseus]